MAGYLPLPSASSLLLPANTPSAKATQIQSRLRTEINRPSSQDTIPLDVSELPPRAFQSQWSYNQGEKKSRLQTMKELHNSLHQSICIGHISSGFKSLVVHSEMYGIIKQRKSQPLHNPHWQKSQESPAHIPLIQEVPRVFCTCPKSPQSFSAPTSQYFLNLLCHS